MTPPSSAPIRLPLALGMLLAIYLAGAGAVLFAPPESQVASWWPAAGVAITLIMIAPRRSWPLLAVGIVIAVALANVTGGRDVEISVLFGVANAGEAVVAGWFLRRGRHGPVQLKTQDDFIRLVAAVLLGGLVVATAAALSVRLVEGGFFFEVWVSVLPSHAASSLVIVPVAMAVRGQFNSRDHQAQVGSMWELAFQAISFAAVTVVVFSPNQPLPLVFVPLPFFVWAALRFDVWTVAWELAAFSVAVTYLTAEGFGPIGLSYLGGRIDAHGAGALTQGYLVCSAVMSLPLAVAVAQRHNLLSHVTASERLFRRNFTESLVGMVLLRCQGLRLEIIDLNGTAARLLGGNPEDFVGRPLSTVLETREQLDLITARMLSGHQEGWRAQTGLRNRPEARVNVSLSKLSGSPDITFAAQLHDVTAEYDARSKLEAAEKLTSATLDTTACVIMVTDPRGTIIRVNAATLALTEFSEDDLLGRPVWETSFAPTTAAEITALFGPTSPDAPRIQEADGRTKSGSKLRIVWNHNVVLDEQRRPAYAVMTGVDVTAERTAAGVMSHLLEAAITTALIGTDTAGRITVFNSGAQNLLGYQSQEMLGRPFADLVESNQLLNRLGTSEPDRAFATMVELAGLHGDADRRDWTWVAKNGEHHTVSMTLSAAADAFAAQVGFLCVGRDVTEQRESQEMLLAALDKERTAVDRLRQLDDAKNEFVSTVSHELRTPVTSIVGYTEMLTDGSMVEPLADQVPMLETIARNGQRLIAICNDLLMLSGVDSDATQWEQETFDLGTLLVPVEESTRHLLKGRDLTVEFIGPEQPLLVDGDRAQLERVLINLLSNAVKFTDDGGRISCRLEQHDLEAWVIVQDNGMGIPEHEQTGLFQRFFRSSSAQTRAIQGTGLGLSIVSAIVAAHEGHVDVDSAESRGTTFTVRLPRKVGAALG